MFRKLGRLFVIKTRWEAYLIIYALALGATSRGAQYLTQYPGFGGKLLFLACTGAVFLAGAKILDCIKLEKENEALLAERAEVNSIPQTAAIGFGKRPPAIDEDDLRSI